MTQQFTPLRRLSTSPAIAAADDRTFGYTFSTGDVALDNHRLDPNGWDLSRCQPPNNKLPFNWAHDMGQPPIGSAFNIGVRNGALRGSVRYATADEYPFADTIFRLVKGGFLYGTSVGFIPTKGVRSTDPNRPGGYDYSNQLLLEASQCAVGADPKALADARSAGIDMAPLIAWTDKQLDEGSNAMPRNELEIIRRAAGAPKLFAVPSPDDRAREARAAAAKARKGEFPSFGSFLQTVASRAAGGRQQPDPRLTRAPSGASEVDPTGGGFLVPDEFTSSLIGSLYEEAVIAPLCDRRTTDKPNNASLPAIDETSRADGSRWGGTLSYWEGEATTPPTSLPKFKSLKFGAHKLIALCVATEELLADVPMLEAHMRRAFAAEASFQLDRAILKGTPGMPAGILNSAGLITQAKAESQAAGTVIAENIASMWSRLPAPCKKRAVWLVSEDVSQQLELIGTGSPSTIGLYMAADGTPLLKGRPVIEIEQASLLGRRAIFVWSTFRNMSSSTAVFNRPSVSTLIF